MVAVMFPLLTDGAEVYVDPNSGVIDREQGVFAVDIRVDNQDECVNVMEVSLRYPQEHIKATLVSRGRSILTLWQTKPRIDQDRGEVYFVGGIPGGYCGRIPGDPELTNVLATVVFQPVESNIIAEEIWLDFDPTRSKVLLSDNLGTDAEAEFVGGRYGVGPVGTIDASEWSEVLQVDQTPPEMFDVELTQDPSVFDGRYYIVFSTVDKGSGISHYQVKEEDLDRPGYVRGEDRETVFKRADSPYVLEDQSLNSLITVRAVDKAGNERSVRLLPDEELRTDEGVSFLSQIVPAQLIPKELGLGVMVLLVLFLAGLFYRHKKVASSEKYQAGELSSNDHDQEHN